MLDINLLRPEAASEFANQVDTLYGVLWLLTIFFTSLVLLLITVFAIRYRRGSLADRSRPVDHDLRIELVWSIIPLVLGLGIFAWAAKLYANVYGEAPKSSKEVFVIGKQWMWHLQHMNGMRENNELHVPIDTPIKLTMVSQDVIHSFFLPSMRVKRDVLPGRYTTVWFQPNRIGKYRLECSEYCGTQHSLMGGWIYVMSKADFAKWYATGGQTGGSAGAGNTGGPGGMEAAGAQLAQEQGCTNCHAAPGQMARAPSWVGLYNTKVKLADGGQVIANDAYIRESILNPNAKVVNGFPVPSIMPPYQGLLSEEQVLSLVSYVKALKDPKGQAAQQLAQGGPTPSTRLNSPYQGSAANTEDRQADFIGSRHPDSLQERPNPATTNNIQSDLIQRKTVH